MLTCWIGFEKSMPTATKLMSETLPIRNSSILKRLQSLPDQRLWRALSYGLFVLIGLIVLITFRQYGVTTDEEVQAIYGDKVVAWYGSFFHDRRALDFTFIYGGFFEAV